MEIKRSAAIAKSIDAGTIGADDSFRFHCKMCGKCCRNREDILLNPYDLFRMAKELKTDILDVYNNYCESFLGKTSHMLLIRLLPKGPDKHCPLLNGKRCSVHKGKPTVCALFPLGRMLNTKTGSADCIGAEVRYLVQKTGCGDQSESHTVREWLAEFDLSAEDDFFVRWSQTVLDYGSIIRQAEKLVSERGINMICSAIMGCGYLNYDTTQPFLDQFISNDSKLRETMSRVGLEPERSK